MRFIRVKADAEARRATLPLQPFAERRPLLLSMTGFGEARRQENGLAVTAEVRTVNNRYFKLSVRLPEGYGALEAEIETLLRQRIKRGSFQVNLRVDRQPQAEDFRINTTALESYRRQLIEFSERLRLDEAILPSQLLLLPGVVDENIANQRDLEHDWPPIRATLEAAIENLERMRCDEGRAMAANLAENCDTIAGELESISERAPLVADGYRVRLEERVKKALEAYNVNLDPSDLLREVSLFAERSDISEEIIRLRSHVEQFRKQMELKESTGRKLEFVTQEMFRESNTIGSKANDVEISRRVIEIKASIERMREMIQNVE